MMKIAVLIVAFSCCLCKAQVQVKDRSGSTSWTDIYSLISITQSLGAMGEKLANMAEKITLLEAKLQNTENDVLELQNLTIGKPEVAFSVALGESGSDGIGPFTTPTPLKYKRVFSNTGNSYNSSTEEETSVDNSAAGIFTAIVNGTYFFQFSVLSNHPPESVVSLMKNGERLTSVWDIVGSDRTDMGSNAVVIPLEVGDNVCIQLMANKVVYDDAMNYNTFSGFLLFTI